MRILLLLTGLFLLSNNCETCPKPRKKVVVEEKALTNMDRARLEQRAPETLRRYDSGKKMKIDDVIELSQAGISDDKIIYMIDRSQSHYDMTTKKIFQLKNAGVSQRLIDYMINYT